MKSKPDYAFKSAVLRLTVHGQNICVLADRIDRAFYAYANGYANYTGLDYDSAKELQSFLLRNYREEYAEASKINRSFFKQRSRLAQRLQYILTQEHASFLTLTFRDDVLQNTSEDTRRQYVRRFLASYGALYVANVDYGGRNGREHYHAVISARVKPSEWSYGLLNCKSIDYRLNKVPKRYEALSPSEQREKVFRDNKLRLSKYVAKLANHAIKETTKRKALIYSKMPHNWERLSPSLETVDFDDL